MLDALTYLQQMLEKEEDEPMFEFFTDKKTGKNYRGVLITRTRMEDMLTYPPKQQLPGGYAYGNNDSFNNVISIFFPDKQVENFVIAKDDEDELVLMEKKVNLDVSNTGLTIHSVNYLRHFSLGYGETAIIAIDEDDNKHLFRDAAVFDLEQI